MRNVSQCKMNGWRKNCLLILLTMFIGFLNIPAVAQTTVRIVWKEGKVKGKIEALNAVLSSTIIQESGKESLKTANRSAFQIANAERQSLVLSFSDAKLARGPESALVTVRTENHAFSFFLRDVVADNPIYIPSYGVAVVLETDLRSYRQIAEDVLSRGLLTKAEQTNLQPEASWDQVAPRTRNMNVPIWLGLTRDMRNFEIWEELQDGSLMGKRITPRIASGAFKIPETGNSNQSYSYALGRGVGPLNNIRRWLENGTLPIYHSETRDDDVVYHSISFASLEKTTLVEENIVGTDYLISDINPWRIFTPDQKIQLEEKQKTIPPPDQEVVLYCHTQIVNTGKTPRYAWFKLPSLYAQYRYDPATGFSIFASERIFCVSMLNGQHVPAEEMAILIQPGDSVCLDFRLTHSPIDAERAADLREKSFDEQYAACLTFWEKKLNRAAKIHIPEKRINEMLQANLLHCDLVTIGIEPDEPLAAKVGGYNPIGTESSPIIQYYCSMGLDVIARRSLEYFFVTQQSDGKIQNYNTYTIETGAVLWCVGEYFRYTRDEQWIRQKKPGILKACEYLMNWRKSDENGLRMISGKVADPEDHNRQFILNGYACMGMSRMAEVMRELGEPEAAFLAAEAKAWRDAIRKAAIGTMEKSPVVPLGDGTWVSTMPPWPEEPGPRILFQKAEKFRTHGAFTVPDAMLGPEYLVFCEVFDLNEPVSQAIMNYSAELMYLNSSGFSQPYYCRLNWWQVFTGKVKPFLDAYYTTMSAHADRQTYTFWEHLFRAEPHKTHEAAGFLMQTRWMLYQEQSDTLKLFSAIPRAWMEEGKEIRLEGVKSYFGALNVTAMGVKNGVIEATVECQGDRKPRNVMVRLPHPEGKKPVAVSVGKLIPETESILIENFTGEATLRLEF